MSLPREALAGTLGLRIYILRAWGCAPRVRADASAATCRHVQRPEAWHPEAEQAFEGAVRPERPGRPAAAARRGAAQAGGLAYGMWLVSTGVDAYFDRQALPNQYTVRNITVTIRTVTQGLAYLATFIFGANAVGLTGARRVYH